MGNEKVCGVAAIRREVCWVSRPDRCFDDHQEKGLCGTETEVKKELTKLCAGYFSGIGPGNRHHKEAWVCQWRKR